MQREELLTLDEVARAHVQVVLDACRGNRSNAARVLGIDRKTLARALKRWGIAVARTPKRLAAGSLVAIEGIDGAGITTQVALLVAYLNGHGHRALATVEPSAGLVGQLIRKVLAKQHALPRAGAMRTLSLLFAADRVDHYHRVVAPALAAGTTVVSDRWYHSSLAYQRTGVERDWIATLNRHTRTPDVTIVLEVPPDSGHQRRVAAGRVEGLFQDEATRRDLIAGYRATIAELRGAGERIEVIDGTRSIDAVAGELRRIVGVT